MLTVEHVRILTEGLGPRMVENWGSRAQPDREQLLEAMLTAVVPVLAELDSQLIQDPSQVLTFDFTLEAEALLTSRFGGLMLYRGMDAEEIARDMGPEIIDGLRVWIRKLVSVSLNLLRPEESLEGLVSSLDSWDPNAELASLTHDDGHA